MKQGNFQGLTAYAQEVISGYSEEDIIFNGCNFSSKWTKNAPQAQKGVQYLCCTHVELFTCNPFWFLEYLCQ